MTSFALTLDPALQITLRGFLALLFFWAVSHKVHDLTRFRSALAAYNLVPSRFVNPVTALIVLAEVWVVVGLSIRSLVTWAALAAISLLFVYTAAISINLLRGRREIDCGCAGTGERPLSLRLVARNAVLVGLSALCALPSGTRALLWIDAVTSIAAVATLGLLYVATDTLLSKPSGYARRRVALERFTAGVGNA